MIKVVASFFVLMVMISAGTVYSLKETTERLEARKHQLSASILQDRAAIKVLRAEMAYLSQPARLQKLSRRFLDLAPSRSYQMAGGVNRITGRGDFKLASLPVDEFPQLLPQEKPAFQKKKFNSHNSQVATVSHQLVRKSDFKKASFVVKVENSDLGFYERLSLKLGDGE